MIVAAAFPHRQVASTPAGLKFQRSRSATGSARALPASKLGGSWLMRARVVLAFSIAVLLAAGRAVFAQRSASFPDLQGTWNGSTLTPLQRLPQFGDRSAFTPEEAAEYARASPDRIPGFRRRLIARCRSISMTRSSKSRTCLSTACARRSSSILVSRDRRRSGHVAESMDRRMAVQGGRHRAVQRRVPRGQLRDRELPSGRACRRAAGPGRTPD